MTAAARLRSFVLIALAFPSAMAAERICLPDFIEELARPIRIEVGCEVIDCCPGCPLAQRLDWRVRVAGEAVAAADIEPPAPRRQPFRAPGENWRDSSDEVGESAQSLGTALLRVRLNEAVIERWRRAASVADSPESPLGSISIDVEQLKGGVVVNQHHFDWTIMRCFESGSCDRVATTGNRAGDNSVILTDDRRASIGCSDDSVWRTSSTAAIGNALSPGACRSEVAVFSEADATELRENVAWTDACGDQLDVALDPIVELPGIAFLAVPDTKAELEWGGKHVEEVAKLDAERANLVYDRNKIGVALRLTQRKLNPLDFAKLLFHLGGVAGPIASALLSGGDPSAFVCALPSALESAGLYVPGQLNVYYLPVPGTGMMCEDDPNVIFVGLDRKPETLAHEGGHSLALVGPGAHTNGLAGFDAHNLMWVDEPDVRDHVSLGQAFRMNVDAASVLNTNGARVGPTRSCPTDKASGDCPALNSDWTRP